MNDATILPSAEGQPPSRYVQKAMELAEELAVHKMCGDGTEEAREALRLHLESALPKKAEASPAEEGWVAADARRYRWLRRRAKASAPTAMNPATVRLDFQWFWPGEMDRIPTLDGAIDAAITATKEKKHGD